MINIESLIEVTLKEPDDFLKVKETLTRIGVASKKSNTLFQSCHILHKQGKYYIVHFKELFALDGKQTDLNEDDISRRNTIAKLLAEWDLVGVVNEDQLQPADSMSSIKVIPFSQKSEWELVAKYNIGKKK
jgi:hypothetical protein|tara:strand:- start:765 stop:1157 length:393 start_codon:yes stop_codon:yes gene_type:complete